MVISNESTTKLVYSRIVSLIKPIVVKPDTTLRLRFF